ncbi:MAG: tetratricopeptide repeat protein [Alphaproteobacteria bacterium]
METKRPNAGAERAADLRQRAARALRAGDAGSAEALARQSLAANPQDRGALYLLGLALLGLGRSADAVEPLQAAAQGNPDPAVETNLATALAQSGREKEALEWLARAASREPPFAPAFVRLGRLLHIRGRIVEAKAALQRAVELAPEDGDALLAYADALTDLGESRAARIVYTQALGVRPGWTQAQQGIVRTLMDEANFEAPIAMLRRLAAREPKEVSILLDLAYCLQEAGRLEEALAIYGRAAETDPRAYKKALHSLIGAARGTFWLRPSVAAKKLPHRD